jgi:hypothetical protein
VRTAISDSEGHYVFGDIPAGPTPADSHPKPSPAFSTPAKASKSRPSFCSSPPPPAKSR